MKVDMEKINPRDRHKYKPLCFNGEQYTYKELSDLCGVNIKTLRTRVHDHPDITFEKLTAPAREAHAYLIEETIDGVTKPLYQWAKDSMLSYDTLYARYKSGKRGKDLITPPTVKNSILIGMKPILTEKNMEWLLETKKYREGQADEWEIACELIGAHPSWATWLKQEFERRGLA